MNIQQKLVTIAEFEVFTKAHPEGLFELINGEIVEKMTTEEHGVIAVIIASEIRFFLKSQEKLKGHVTVESSYRRAEDETNERRPDVAFRITEEEPQRS